MGRLYIIATLMLLASVLPAEATIFFDENLEGATVPLDPTKTTIQNIGSAVQGWNGAPTGGWNMGRSWNRNNGEPYSASLDLCYFADASSDTTGILAAAGGAHSGTKVWVQNYKTQDCDPNWGPACNEQTSPQCFCSRGDNCGLFYGNDSNAPNPSALNATSELWLRAWVLPANTVGPSYGVDAPRVGLAKIIYLKNNVSIVNLLWETYADNNNTGGPYPNLSAQNWQVAFEGRNNLNSTPLTQRVWHCYEWHFKFNTQNANGTWNADGIAEGWVDRVQYMGYYNLQPNGPNVVPGRFDAFNIWRQSALTGSILFWDDIAAGDQRIGCPATGTTPGAPTNLRFLRHWIERFWAWLIPVWAVA